MSTRAHILGIGVDLCEVARLQDLDARYGDRFVARVFTADERERCAARRRRHECLAGRFAAKEAALKALGTGLSQGIAWQEVELVGRESQPPTIRFHGRAAEIAAGLGVAHAHVSISHDGGHAIAVVVLEGGGS